MAPRAAGTADAGPLDRGAEIRHHHHPGVRPRHRAAALCGTRPQSANAAADRRRRPAAGRSRHEVDGRLRRGRSEGHGAAHYGAAGGAERRPRQPVRVRRRGLAHSRRHRQAVRQSARRASLHRRARIPPLRHADQQYRRAPRRRHPRRPGARAQLRHRGRRRPDGARRAVQCDARRHGARDSRRRRSCRCSAISGRLPSATSSTCAA